MACMRRPHAQTTRMLRTRWLLSPRAVGAAAVAANLPLALKSTAADMASPSATAARPALNALSANHCSCGVLHAKVWVANPLSNLMS